MKLAFQITYEKDEGPSQNEMAPRIAAMAAELRALGCEVETNLLTESEYSQRVGNKSQNRNAP